MENLSAIELSDLLSDLNACREARKWQKDKDLKTVWETCERGDWLLWLLSHMADKPNWPTHKQVVLAACNCAETSLKYVPKDELSPKICIETIRNWVAGKVTIKEVNIAADAAAYAAKYAVNAAADAAYAAYAAADSAYSADTAEYAAYAASYAAYAAAYAADAEAYAADAAKAALKECADIVRRTIPLVFDRG